MMFTNPTGSPDPQVENGNTWLGWTKDHLSWKFRLVFKGPWKSDKRIQRGITSLICAMFMSSQHICPCPLRMLEAFGPFLAGIGLQTHRMHPVRFILAIQSVSIPSACREMNLL